MASEGGQESSVVHELNDSMKFIREQKEKLLHEKNKLEERLKAVQKELKTAQGQRESQKGEMAILRQKLHLSKEEVFRAKEDFKKVEGRREELVEEMCLEEFKMQQILHSIEQATKFKAKQEKIQGEYARKVVAVEGDPFESDPEVIRLRQEIESLEKTKKRLEDKEPLAMQIASGEGLATIQRQMTALDMGLKQQQSRVKQLELDLQAEEKNKAGLQKQLVDIKASQQAELAQIEKRIQNSTSSTETFAVTKSPNDDDEEDVFDDDDMDFLMIPTQES